ncbi:MAG: inositol monophosphatase, partial [Gammaproteobacteria bacterium]|nr:inositol monophosphatase [Gammaproteobacteria bacterium]
QLTRQIRMQPAIKMALRMARQSSDYLRTQFERSDLGNPREDATLKLISHLERAVYDSCVEQLQRAYRDHYIAPAGDIHGEGHEQSWHVFPLLGDGNFARGLPDFAIALLQKQRNRAEHLVLISPMSHEEYTVSRGYGASLNGRRIRASEVKAPHQASVATDLFARCRQSSDPLVWGELAATIGQHTAGVRVAGCAALDLARVACGRLDAAILTAPSLADTSMGLLL